MNEVILEKDFIKENKKYIDDISGGWHETKFYPLNKNSYEGLTCAGVTCGCGLGQMYGILYFSENNLEKSKKLLKQIEEDYKNDGVGCFIATLGQNWYKKEPLLLELGFVLVKEYSNYRHGQAGDYKQKMYTYSF